LLANIVEIILLVLVLIIF